MKYDFTSLMNRSGHDSIAVDQIPIPGAEVKEGFSRIPMWVADMNFPSLPTIQEAIHARVNEPHFGYFNLPDAYFDSIIRWQKERNGVEDLPREAIGYENGVLGCVASAAAAFTSPGESILLHSPTYIGFTGVLENCGRNIVLSDLVQDENGVWRMDYADMDRKLKEHNIHFVIFCSPHNPTGRVWTEDELKKTVEICKKYDKWIICDEIHCDLIRRGVTFIPIMNVAPEYADRIVVCTAPSKTFNLAGMKTSNIVIHNKELQKKWKDYVNGSLSMDGASALGMTAMIAAYTEGEEWLEQLKDYLDGNFAYIDEYLKKNLPKAHLVKAEGTYLAWLDLNGYVDRDEKKLEELMQKKAKVALDEGYIFGEEGRGFERINVASPRSVIEECMNRIRTAFEEEKLV